MAGSLRFACPINFAGGRKYSSSFQCTAICASFSRCFGLLLVLLAALRALATAMAPPGVKSEKRSYDEELPRRSVRRELWASARRRTRGSLPAADNAPASAGSQSRECAAAVERGCGFVIKDKFEPATGHLSVCRRSVGRRAQCCRWRRQLHRISGTAIYGRSAGGRKCHEYAGAVGGSDGERRRVSQALEYFAPRDDPPDRDAHRGPGGRSGAADTYP